MRVLILGGDGYLGWPTAMHLSAMGHNVTVVDNYLRRDLMRNENVDPLYPVLDLNGRISVWKEVTGRKIELHIGDLNQWSFVSHVFKKTKPDTVIHYAEQPSAPYSMLRRESATLTIKNNLGVTANVIFAVREFCPDAHIIKLGTMGEYGTPNIDIEEGWINIKHKGRKEKFLYPRQAGSLYHTTKIMDTDLLWYYVRTWGLRVTDLMQGPVYGVDTDESESDERLSTIFSYDELFGTVLNRFITQAVANYPLTVYGKGEQTRGYLNIKDALNCVRLSLENPAEQGELKIFNQFTETFTVNELAVKVQSAAKLIGLNVEINNIENPRDELEDHYYKPQHTGLLDLGLDPIFLTDDVLVKMLEKVVTYKNSIEIHKIYSGTKWK
jgi:UDP-sulfoquinovose synthase